MTPELRLKVSTTAIGNYIKLSKERCFNLPSTDSFSEAVQQALITVFGEGNQKQCPLKESSSRSQTLCTEQECAWYNLSKNRCGVVSKAVVCKENY